MTFYEKHSYYFLFYFLFFISKANHNIKYISMNRNENCTFRRNIKKYWKNDGISISVYVSKRKLIILIF